jgi:ATP-dependent DNA helicase RecG
VYTASSDFSPDGLALINGGMNLSLHWFPEDVQLSQLASTMVGMANAEGGTIILGVSPRAGELMGVSEPQSALEKVFQAALLSDPTLVLPMARQVLVQRPGIQKPVNLILISVPPGLPNVYSYDGKYYGRDGSHTSQLSASRLYQLLNERGSIQFESRLIPDANLTDLDSDDVMAYAHAVGDIPPGDINKSYDFLMKRGCLKRVDGSFQITYAALLLFGHYPQQWLPNVTILASRFPGRSFSDSYIKQDICGNLLNQLRQAEEFIRANLKTVIRLKGLAHQESLEYPFEAVRELLVNAVAHRDYNLQGDNIHLNIFSDHLVVSSPGTLPGPVTLENLLIARFARNAVISQVLSDMGFVERLGYGLDRVVYVAKKEGMPSPRFEEVAGTFQVTLFANLPFETSNGKIPDLSAYASLDLNPRQQLALAQLAVHQRITNHEYQTLCPDVHVETLRRDLVDLVSRGILIKVGDKKATYYILKRV